MEMGKFFKRTIQLGVLFFCLFSASNNYAQNIDFDIRLTAGAGIYEGYVRPDFSINPPLDLTLSSQVTIVALAGQPVIPLFGEAMFNPDCGQVVSTAGAWGLSARINRPPEYPEFNNFSVDLASSGTTAIIYQAYMPVPMFNFEWANFFGIVQLIDSDSDPFKQLPNNDYSNPGNEISELGDGDDCLWIAKTS